MSRRSSWLSIRTPLSPTRATTLKVCAFILPLLTWALVSYVPWVGHPMMRITDKGDSYYKVGDRTPRQDFADLNASLLKDGQKPVAGEPANPFWLPAPHEVARAMYTAFTTPPVNKRDPWLHESLWHSLKMIAYGFTIAAVFAVPVGLVCGTFDFFSKLTEPFLDFFRYMPAPAFAALLVGIFGIADEPKIALIVLATFFSMVLVIANTTRGLDVALLEAAQTLGATKKGLLLRVVLPGVLPNIYNDMRIMIGASWTALMIAEVIGEAAGLGLYISRQVRYFHFENAYAVVILIGLIGLATDQTLQWLGRFLFPWQAKPVDPVSRSVVAAITFVPRKVLGLIRRPRSSSSSEGASNVSVA
jgi:NitT/TauT family transport system permease protein